MSHLKTHTSQASGKTITVLHVKLLRNTSYQSIFFRGLANRFMILFKHVKITLKHILCARYIKLF